MACPLCTSAEMNTRCNIEQCLTCGSAFSLGDVPVRYYEDCYQFTERSTAAGEHRRLYRLPEQIQLIRAIACYRPAPCTLLDIGCDKGHFLDEARRFGYTVAGVEPSVSSSAYCNQIGLNVVPSTDAVAGTFDVAVMWHSLEHFQDPNEALETLRCKLSPEGYLFLRVPDYSCIWSRALGSQWVWFQPTNHRTHFSASGLRQLLRRHGFTVIRLDSRRPCTMATDLAFSFASLCYGRQPMRKSLGRFYEHMTGVELFCVSRL